MIDVLTRRSLVKRGLGLAAATLPFAHLESAAALGRRLTSPVLARSRFTPLLGAKLRMSGAPGSATVRLVAIRDLRPARRAGDDRCFSLLFEASSRVDWPQATYRFRAPKLGELSLLAVPMGSRCYEVVINAPS